MSVANLSIGADGITKIGEKDTETANGVNLPNGNTFNGRVLSLLCEVSSDVMFGLAMSLTGTDPIIAACSMSRGTFSTMMLRQGGGPAARLGVRGRGI